MNSFRKLSRRELMIGGGATLFYGAASAFPLSRPLAFLTGQNALNSARLISLASFADPAFSVRMDVLFPGLRQNSVFQVLGAGAALITHVKGPSVRALSTVWTITTPSGVQRKPVFYGLRSGRSKLNTGQQHLLRPGHSRLLTPFFSWTPARFNAQPLPDWQAVLNRGEFRQQLAQQLGSITGIGVELDAVIFSDWVVSGPDSAGLARRLALKRNAEHDEAVSLLRQIPVNGSRAQVAHVLKRHQKVEGIAGETVPATDPVRRLYYQARRRQAQALLKRFKQSDVPTFIKTLTALRRTPKIQLTALSA